MSNRPNSTFQKNDLIDAARVRLNAQPATKEQAIRAAGELLVASGCIAPEYVQSLLAREAAANTYLGEGVAIPHGEIAARHHIRRTGVAVLQVPQGIAWREGERAHLIVAIAAQSDEHLALLRRLTRLLQDPAHIAHLAQTTSVADILAAFEESAPAQGALEGAAQAHDYAEFFDWTMHYPNGLHARPAQQWVRTASGFASAVRVRVMEGADGSAQSAAGADAKNLIELLQLGAGCGARLRVSAQGADAAAALAALARTMDALLATEKAEAAAAQAAREAAERRARWSPANADGPCLRGVAASPGLAIGRVRLRGEQDVFAQVVDIADNLPNCANALSAAMAKAAAQLEDLAAQSQARLGAGKGEIFRAQAELLNAPELLQASCALIAQGHGAAWSWARAVQQSAQALAALPNPVLAARAADVRDVGARVLRNLQEHAQNSQQIATNLADLPEKSPKPRADERPVWAEVATQVSSGAALGEDGIGSQQMAASSEKLADVVASDALLDVIVAVDLAPSDTATLDTTQVAALCTAEGGPTSHTAIIARTLGLPAVVALGAQALSLADGQIVVVDGDAGRLYWDLSAQDLASARDWQRRERSRAAELAAQATQPAATADGVRIEVAANLTNATQAAQAIAAGAEGVGLMRTEFLFLERESAPSEQEQYESYCAMLHALAGRPLIIRTLDIGGDKQVTYLNLPAEENPFLGVRGVRLLLRRPDLLDTQLRAIYRAARDVEPSGSGDGPALSVMFPMVTSLAEIAALKDRCERIRAELHAPRLPLGIMVEVPAAAAMADQFARHVDFFSIGTNDLTQYVLAIDRQHPQLAREADSLHPAVLRMIAQTIAGARAATAAGHACWVGVCGGMAGDPLGAAILAGLGARELSMSVRDIAAVKAALRSHSMAALQTLAARALDCADAAGVRTLAGELHMPEQTKS